MKLKNIKEVEEFRKVIHPAPATVTSKSQDGDVFNLKSALSEYIALGQLLSEQGDNLGSLPTSAKTRRSSSPSSPSSTKGKRRSVIPLSSIEALFLPEQGQFALTARRDGAGCTCRWGRPSSRRGRTASVPRR